MGNSQGHATEPKIHYGPIVAWLIGLACGICVLADYENLPGVSASPLARLPERMVESDSKHPTLIVFLHPHCPCSRATLSELERVASRSSGLLSIDVYFLDQESQSKAENAAALWVQGDLWTWAGRLPNTRRLRDPAGRTAAIFGAKTSGQVFLYDEDRNLVFEGGLTMSRGHEGDNVGIATVLQYLSDARVARNSTPVFGCALSNEVYETATGVQR